MARNNSCQSVGKHVAHRKRGVKAKRNRKGNRPLINGEWENN